MKNFCKTLGIAAVMGVQLMMLHSCCKHNSSDDDMSVLPIVMNTVQAGTKAIIDNPDGEERLKQMMNACYDDQHNNVGGFGVYGYKKAGTLAPQLLFNNTRVFPDDESNAELKPWIYRPIRYWDRTASYQFIAYWPHLPGNQVNAPYVEAPHTVTTVDKEYLLIHNIPNWQYADGTEIDLMTDVEVGRFETEFYTGKVNFRFRHLLSQLIIKAYYVGTEYPVTETAGVKSGGVRINGITLSEYEPADATETALLKTGQTKFQVMDYIGIVNFTQTLQSVSNTTVTMDDDAVLLENANAYINFKDEMQENPNFEPAKVGTWLIVPHRWYKLNLTVNDFKVGTEANSRVSKTVPVQLGQQVYDYVTQPGRTYVITLLFNTLEGGLQVESVVEQTWTEHNVPRELYNL